MQHGVYLRATPTTRGTVIRTRLTHDRVADGGAAWVPVALRTRPHGADRW